MNIILVNIALIWFLWYKEILKIHFNSCIFFFLCTTRGIGKENVCVGVSAEERTSPTFGSMWQVRERKRKRIAATCSCRWNWRWFMLHLSVCRQHVLHSPKFILTKPNKLKQYLFSVRCQHIYYSRILREKQHSLMSIN